MDITIMNYQHPSLTIDSKRVSYSDPCFVIAEACDNHMGDIHVAMDMIRLAKLAGADAIKFQHHIPDEEMLPDVPMSTNFDEPLYDFLKKNALSFEDHAKLKAYSDQIGIIYLCTPFSLAAAIELSKLDLPAYKIGSGEMTDIPSLVRIAELGKPLIISTGMSTFDEIERTYRSLSNRSIPISLLNCVSEYPPLYSDINLNVIPKMIEKFSKSVIGHSDHTPDLYTSFAAVTLGARIIEKHVIIDKRTPGPDQSVSIDFQELASLVSGIRKIEAASGSVKKVHKKEEEIRRWAFRSIVSVVDINDGDLINDSMIWSKRPGTGIPSYLMDQVVGKTAKRKIPKNTLIAFTDIE